jgi:hypothetical protein
MATEEDIWAKRDEATGEWRRLQPEKLYGLYFPPNTTRMVNLRRKGWAGHVNCARERIAAF